MTLRWTTRQCQDEQILHFGDMIEGTAVPNVPGLLTKKKFYPIDSLREIFPNDQVQRILEHRCERCNEHLSGNNAASLVPSSADTIMQSDAALSLFALLVWMGYPLLIGGFLNSYGQSIPLPRFLSQFDLYERILTHLPERPREKVTARFQEVKWCFSAPSFEDGSFKLYEKGTVLPYLMEERIDRGGFSEVYKVEVHSSYCKLEHYKRTNSTAFVRKEFRGHDTIEFMKEKTNLERIATLKSPHLAQIQATYQLGDKYNILFPLAKTNLYQYLRKRDWQAPCPTNISTNPLWEQVLGITYALKKIIHFTHPDDPRKVLFGYHLDLKDENILVDSSSTSADILKITDFGQTRFVDPSLQTTNASSGFGGTEAYAPPEYMVYRPDSVYDIWSLGIIVLEILAYATMGTEGLVNEKNGLDNVRHTRDGYQANSKFYIGNGDSAKVKPAIVNWMVMLANRQGAGNRPFVEQMLALINRMLEPQRRNRITIDEVVSEMSSIFNRAPSEATEIPIESKLGLEHDELVLVNLKDVQFFPRGTGSDRLERLSVPFIMVENRSHRLRTWVGVPPPVLPACDRRQDLQLSFPFHHVIDSQARSFEISFSAVKENVAASLNNRSIRVNDEAAARLLQMALTGHVISAKTYRLASFEFKRQRNRGDRLRDFLSRGSNTADALESLKPLWLELWKERHPKFPSLGKAQSIGSSSERRPNRQVNPGKKTPRGRVVVYCEDRIFIIQFTRESRVKKEDIKKLGRRELILQPMDERQTEVFPVSEIRPGANSRYPAIPMSHDVLDELEQSTRFLCEEMKIKFENHNDASDFYDLYRNEKYLWLDESKGKPSKIKSLMPNDYLVMPHQ